jgi:hypothetical protein
MGSQADNQDEDIALSDFWARRFILSENEMKSFCILVCKTLNFKASELDSLPEDRDYYINGFIIEKILQPKGRGDFLHMGGLRLMYRNYLKDQIRGLTRRRKVGDYSSGLEFVGGDQGDNDFSFDDSSAFTSEVLECCDAPRLGMSELTILEEYKLTPESVSDSGRSWLSKHGGWVPVYLAHNFCADKEMSEPLVHLASRYGIASYHYKAQKLGINWDYAKARKSGEKFSQTLIGEWLTKELGSPLDAEHEPVIKIAFNLLCLEALYWGEHAEVTP